MYTVLGGLPPPADDLEQEVGDMLHLVRGVDLGLRRMCVSLSLSLSLYIYIYIYIYIYVYIYIYIYVYTYLKIPKVNPLALFIRIGLPLVRLTSYQSGSHPESNLGPHDPETGCSTT